MVMDIFLFLIKIEAMDHQDHLDDFISKNLRIGQALNEYDERWKK